MLEQIFIQRMAKEIGIAAEHLVREAYEMILLRAIAESSHVQKLVFKGGTALRLGYGSPRFSEDLDFSTLSTFSINDLRSVLNGVTRKFPEITVKDVTDKRYTHFGLVHIHEDFLSQAFSIKIEISKRPFQSSHKPGYTLTALGSPTVPFSVFMNVLTLETIFDQKIEAIQTRTKPRDLFDLWFLKEKLKKQDSLSVHGFEKREIKHELHKFLPRPYHYIVDVLIRDYANH